MSKIIVVGRAEMTASSEIEFSNFKQSKHSNLKIYTYIQHCGSFMLFLAKIRDSTGIQCHMCKDYRPLSQIPTALNQNKFIGCVLHVIPRKNCTGKNNPNAKEDTERFKEHNSEESRCVLGNAFWREILVIAFSVTMCSISSINPLSKARLELVLDPFTIDQKPQHSFSFFIELFHSCSQLMFI